MKKFICSIYLFFFSTILFAQSGLGGNDPAAKKILDAVSTKFKTFKSIQSKFNLAIENASGKLMGNKSGTVYMKGTKYRISITGQEIFFDGTNVYTYDKSANEVTITKLDPSVNTLTPQKLFTDFYDKDFLYKLNGDVKLKGKAVQEVELTPVDKTKTFFKVLLWVDKASNTIKGARLFEKSGNRYVYSVSNFNTKANISDAQFQFDKTKYPGVEVVDLR